MLKVVGVNSMQELIDQTIPKHILVDKKDVLKYGSFELEGERSETLILQEFKQILDKNKIFKSYIGIFLCV
jgi:glycine dehydrogenase